MGKITLEMAKKALEAAERWARDIAEFPCSVAVVNKAGAVIAAHRMDGAAMMTTEIAIEKAWSAVAFKQPTSLMSRWLDPRSVGETLGDHAFGMIGRGKGRLCFIQGGIPITGDDGEVIGGIGCSGVPAGVAGISDTSVSQAGWNALYD